MDKYRPCPSIFAMFTSDSQHPPRSTHAVYLGVYVLNMDACLYYAYLCDRRHSEPTCNLHTFFVRHWRWGPTNVKGVCQCVCVGGGGRVYNNYDQSLINHLVSIIRVFDVRQTKSRCALATFSRTHWHHVIVLFRCYVHFFFKCWHWILAW